MRTGISTYLTDYWLYLKGLASKMNGSIQHSDPDKHDVITQNAFRVTDTVSRYARYWLYGALAFLSIATLVLLIVWMVLYKGGVSLDVKTELFNYHPIFMTLGLFLIPLHGMIVYRFVPRSKMTQKVIHSVLMFVGLLMSLTGLVIAEVSLSSNKRYHMWSVHAWCGVASIFIYIVQFALGFIAFFLPITSRWNSMFIVIHRYGGAILTVLPMVTILLGVELYRSVADTQGYPLQGENVIRNLISLSVLILVVLISSAIYGIFKSVFPKVTEFEDSNDYLTIN